LPTIQNTSCTLKQCTTPSNVVMNAWCCSPQRTIYMRIPQCICRSLTLLLSLSREHLRRRRLLSLWVRTVCPPRLHPTLTLSLHLKKSHSVVQFLTVVPPFPPSFNVINTTITVIFDLFAVGSVRHCSPREIN